MLSSFNTPFARASSTDPAERWLTVAADRCRTAADSEFGILPAEGSGGDLARSTSMVAARGPARKILLVDDHPAVSKRIAELLADAFPETEIVAASTGEQGLKLIEQHAFDLVLLDLRLPGCGGIDVLKELRASRPGLPVIIISSLPESPYATLARRAGARGFVTKSALVQELGPAVRTALGDCALA